MRPTILARAAIGLAAVFLIGLAGAGPTSAAGGLAFEFSIADNCALVSGPATALGTVRLLTAGGTQLERREVTLDGSGNGQACFAEAFVAGMKLQGTTGGVTHTIAIPSMTIRSDRTTDVVSGTGPAGKQVTITVRHMTSFTHLVADSWTRTVSSKGRWSIDTTSSFNLIGGDQVSVAWYTGPDIVLRWFVVPRLTVTIGHPLVTSQLASGVGGTVTLRSATGKLRATSYLAGEVFERSESNLFANGSGVAVAVRAGDKVSGPFQPGMTFSVPKVTVAANAATDLVSGMCPAHRALQIEVLGPSNSGPRIAAACSAAGTYAVDTTAKVDVHSGDRVIVSARTSAGDVVRRLVAVP